MLAIPNMVKWAFLIRQSFRVKPAFGLQFFCVMASQSPCPRIIIDSGTGFVKAGLSGRRDKPTAITPSTDDVWLRHFWAEESPSYFEREKRESIVNFEALEKVDIRASKIVIKSV